MKCQRLFEIIDSLKDTYIEVWKDVCNLESPTSYKAGVDAVGEYFAKMAEARGWETEILELPSAGNAICITINSGAISPKVTFSGHIDTVHPVGLFGTPAVRWDEENIYGPGVMDCKGGVVASLLAMDALSRCDFTDRPVQLIIQSDEETSSITSSKKTIAFMCEKARGSVAFLNTEGIQGNTAVLVRKGIVRYRFTVTGKAMHSSRCAEGSNAIAEAAHKIIRLEALKDPKGITCNCGVISGGTVANTVAEECTFVTDFRFQNAKQLAEIQNLVEEISGHNTINGCSCTVTQISYRSAMPLTERNTDLLRKMNVIYQENNLPTLQDRVCLSGSDAAYITEIGIPCVDNLGVEGSFIHSIKEYARLDSLAESAKRLAAVAYCI